MKNQVWKNIPLTFLPENYGLSYAAVPIVLQLSGHTFRIFFTNRNKDNQSEPYFIDLDLRTLQFLSTPEKVKIDLGELGTFDDSGIMPSCIIDQNNELWMYYIGWNLGVTVPFRNSIGLAVSKDNGLSFHKKYTGPVIDRTKDEPHFAASNCVVFHDDIFKIWYLSCTKWELKHGKPTHYYHIKYATSIDGIHWERKGIVAIDFKDEFENAISVPRVWVENETYKMWYSYRSIHNTYQIGYAESKNGIDWIRLDEIVDLATSGEQWDKDMQCYPCVFNYEHNTYMLYNGNGYGKTGFGIAILQR